MSVSLKGRMATGILMIVIYITGYSFARLSGELTRFENKLDAENRHEIRYPSDLSTLLAKNIAEDTDDWLFAIHGEKPWVINRFFFPLRRLETRIRILMDLLIL